MGDYFEAGAAGASSSSTFPPVASTVDQRQVTASDPWDASINSLFFKKAISENCAFCLRCFRKEQVGTIWCYSCGQPMSTQKDLPISPKQIAEMVQDSSEQLLATLGLRVKELLDPNIDPRRIRGVKAKVHRGTSWAEICKNWRHVACCCTLTAQLLLPCVGSQILDSELTPTSKHSCILDSIWIMILL